MLYGRCLSGVLLGALSAPPGARFEKRIHDWYAAAENFPRQLHEIDPAMVRRDAVRAVLETLRRYAPSARVTPPGCPSSG